MQKICQMSDFGNYHPLLNPIILNKVGLSRDAIRNRFQSHSPRRYVCAMFAYVYGLQHTSEETTDQLAV